MGLGMGLGDVFGMDLGDGSRGWVLGVGLGISLGV